MAYVLMGCRALVGLVFLASVVSKLRSRRAYADFVAATGRLAPRRLRSAARPLAATVVGAELAVVGCTAVPSTVLIGFGIAMALLVAFTVAITLSLRRGTRTSCRCFGSSDQPLGAVQVVRNAGLLVVSAAGGISAASAVTTPDLSGGALATVAGVVLAVLTITADDIAALFRDV